MTKFNNRILLHIPTRRIFYNCDLFPPNQVESHNNKYKYVHDIQQIQYRRLAVRILIFKSSNPNIHNKVQNENILEEPNMPFLLTLSQIYKCNRQREYALLNLVPLVYRQYCRKISNICGVILLVLVVISSSSARRFITQSHSLSIRPSISSLQYLLSCPQLVCHLLTVFSKLSLIQKPSKIPVRMS